METSKLGFGLMRLPMKDGAIDIETLKQMADAFLASGNNYFDTSYVYHDGKSEHAFRKAVAERYPRDRYVIATKLPHWDVTDEAMLDAIIDEQLENLGVDYIDYYLIHNVQTVSYNGVDGKGGYMQRLHFFEHLKKWKEEGKVRHIGFSFHSSAQTLAQILDDHPEVEFVQLAINYIDWESQFVQARACYDVARAHGKRVIIMEPVKGGALATLSPDAAEILRQAAPTRSLVSWAFRFLADLDGVITILSGMSTPEQMADNIATFRDLAPLSAAERVALSEAIRRYRDSGPILLSTIARYEGLTYHDVPATALLETYNICQLQPVPNYTDDCNYFKNVLAENGHRDIVRDEDFPPQIVTFADGTDGTSLLRVCEHWLRRNTLG